MVDFAVAVAAAAARRVPQTRNTAANRNLRITTKQRKIQIIKYKLNSKSNNRSQRGIMRDRRILVTAESSKIMKIILFKSSIKNLKFYF